ncbi:MAG: DEAD/DEAH box helicase [Clostridia bacterium]|nr:DEAD/DEAH box helicase [Clostridia bacterium]
MLKLCDVKGVGKANEKKLEELGISSVFGLFSFLPRKYIDLKKPISVLDAEAGALCLLEGRVERVSDVAQGGKRAFFVSFSDNLADNKIFFKATFYNMPFLHDTFEVGQNYRMLTKLSNDVGVLQVVNPTLEKLDKISKLDGIYTVYPLRSLFGQNAFKNILYSALDTINAERVEGGFDEVSDDFFDCFESIHRPNSVDEAEYSVDRLASIDLALSLEIYRKSRKNNKKQRKVLYNFDNFRIDEFVNALGFVPTQSQINAFEDIYADLNDNEYMSRIISGDVGSGKTAVAFFAMYLAHCAKRQAALMVPTEILAKQHAEKFAKVAEKLGIEFAILTSSTPLIERRYALDGLKEGRISCVIGTQSLVGDDVVYKDLAVAIIDEQHKFGVNDRNKLEQKGANDVLSLTATPIPRSMALTFYNDIKISHIEKRESAKTNVQTVLTYDLGAAVDKIVECAKNGKQAFIVCPAIEDSEGFESYSIERFMAEYSHKFCNLSLSILHGKLSNDEKTEAINKFYNKETSVLVATSVIEVGIDTLASEILIVNADRFGLASLHQLRGRVGRDGSPAVCYLHSGNNSDRARERLDALCKSNDGQYLAEVDFSMRGAGEFLGTKQSGTSLTPIFGLNMGAYVLENAKKYADEKLAKLSLDRLLALTRGSKQRVDEFLEAISHVTLNS